MRISWSQLAVGIVLLGAGMAVRYLHAPPSAPAPSTAESLKPTASGAISVNELISNPTVHLGAVTVTGLVTATTRGESFLLVNNSCTSCAGKCEALEMPIRWKQAAPAVKHTVRVTGVLTRTARGFAFTAGTVEDAP